MDWRMKNRRTFRQKRSNLEQRVSSTFIEGDQAVIPCRVERYADVISRYSAKGVETLEPAFLAYVLDIIRFIPEEYGVVLELSGCAFDEEQKRTIAATVKEDMLYKLGEEETRSREGFRNFLLMLAGTVGMGIFLTLVNFVIELEKEFFYIIFWFFGDTLVRYLLQGRSEQRYSRLLAGRLASMTIRFREE